jgi:hypothetical protein
MTQASPSSPLDRVGRINGQPPVDILAHLYLFLEDNPECTIEKFTWRQSPSKTYSTGQTTWTRTRETGKYIIKNVAVTAGLDQEQWLFTLLHELAHVKYPEEHHSAWFYKYAFTLYEEHGVDLDMAADIEYRYRKSALIGAGLAAMRNRNR